MSEQGKAERMEEPMRGGVIVEAHVIPNGRRLLWQSEGKGGLWRCISLPGFAYYFDDFIEPKLMPGGILNYPSLLGDPIPLALGLPNE